MKVATAGPDPANDRAALAGAAAEADIEGLGMDLQDNDAAGAEQAPHGSADLFEDAETVLVPCRQHVPPPPRHPDAFDWSDPDLIVVEHQPRTAVFRNPRGQLVIRQMSTDYGEEDPFVVLNFESAGYVVRALQEWLRTER